MARLGNFMMRPKPVKQQVTIDSLVGWSAVSWDSTWNNPLWLRAFPTISAPLASSGSGTTAYTVYRTFLNNRHFLAWVPGVYEIIHKANGGGGGGADDFYNRDGEGGDGAVGETSANAGWAKHTMYPDSGVLGFYRMKLPNYGRGGAGRDSTAPASAEPGMSGGTRSAGTTSSDTHLGGVPADSSSYDPTPTGNGGAGGEFNTYPLNSGSDGSWGYTKIQLVG